MQVYMLAEPTWGPQLPSSLVWTAIYGELHPGFSWVPFCLRNPIVIPTKEVVGKVTLAYQVPLVVLPMGTLRELTCGPKKAGFWRN